jgi:hypothetical protein
LETESLREVLDNDVVQASGETWPVSPNQFEAHIECRLNFVCYEDSGFQSLFSIWTLGNFAELFENLWGALIALPQINSARLRIALWGPSRGMLPPFRQTLESSPKDHMAQKW